METSTPSAGPPKADLQGNQNIIEIMDPAVVKSQSKDEQSLEQGSRPEVGENTQPSMGRGKSSKPSSAPGAESTSKASLSYEDMHMLPPAATPLSSQFGSNRSSMQDMESYFSPRIPEHSVSTDGISTLQASSTPTTELTIGSDAGQGDNLQADDRQIKDSSVSQDFEDSKVTWRESATQTVIGPSAAKSPMARPTSVPNLNTKSTTNRRREGPEYPVYPDQSFAALQSQQHAKLYQPHPLRTRSSHSSQNSSYSSLSSRQSRDFAMQSGAKTMGNTPAQSPGLFSPTLPRGRFDDTTRTHTLHPSHLQTPTE